MNNFELSEKSESKLILCHPDIQRVVRHAINICEVDFGVGETERDYVRQLMMIETGASTTIKSRHIKREGDFAGVFAVDLYAWVDGGISWDMRYYKKIAKAMFKAAIKEGVDVEWGGLWNNPVDGPHFQLSWIQYP